MTDPTPAQLRKLGEEAMTWRRVRAMYPGYEFDDDERDAYERGRAARKLRKMKDPGKVSTRTATWTDDAVADEIGISHGLANRIRNLDGVKPATGFRTLQGYCRHVCKIARRTQNAEAIQAYANRRNGSRAPAPASTREDEKPHEEAPPDDDRAGMDPLEATLLDAQKIVATLGRRCASDPDNFTQLDRFTKLQGQLLKADEAWRSKQAALGLVYKREDVHELISGLSIAFRACLDSLMLELTSPINLPTWVEDHGATIENQQAFIADMRTRLYQLVEPRVNELASQLRDGHAPGLKRGKAKAESRIALADALEADAKRLRAGT